MRGRIARRAARPAGSTSTAPLAVEVAVVTGVVLAVLAVQVVTGRGSTAARATFGVVELAAAGWACAAGVGAGRRATGSLARSWFLLAGGFASWSVGQAVFAVHDVLGLSLPATNSSDAPFALHTALLVLSALVQVISLSRRHVGWRAAADGALLALSVLTLSWIAWLRPVVRDFPGRPVELLVPLSYPVADLVFLTLAVTALTLTGWSRSGGLVLLGGLFMTPAVSAYTYAVINGRGFTTGGLPDVGWILAMSSFALAGRHSGRQALPAVRRPEAGVVLHLPYLLAVPALAAAGLQLLLDPDPVVVVLVMTLSAVTLARQSAVLADHRRLLAVAEDQRAELDRLAHVDPLTGLDNRRRFTRHLDEAVAAAVRGEGRATVVFIDLDRFKAVNDTLGHAAGDELLAVVARRLRGCLRPEDHCARWGGDEFACLLTTDEVDPVTLEERIRRAVEHPVELSGQTVVPGASIGATTFTEVRGPAGDGGTAGEGSLRTGELVDALLARADERMYDVKASRRSTATAPRPSPGAAAPA